MSLDIWADIAGNTNNLVNKRALKNAIDNGVFGSTGATLTSQDYFIKSAATSLAQVNNPSGTTTDFVKVSDLVATWGHSGTLYSLSNSHNVYTAWGASSSACSGYGSSYQTVFWNGTIGSGTVIYTGVGYYSVGSGYFYYIGGYYVTFSSVYNDGLNNYYTIGAYATCSISYTNVYLHVSAFSAGSQPTTVTAYSDAGNTTPINVNTNVTVYVQYDDGSSNIWDTSGVILSGTNHITFNSGLSGSALPPQTAFVDFMSPTVSSTQAYLPN